MKNVLSQTIELPSAYLGHNDLVSFNLMNHFPYYISNICLLTDNGIPKLYVYDYMTYLEQFNNSSVDFSGNLSENLLTNPLTINSTNYGFLQSISDTNLTYIEAKFDENYSRFYAISKISLSDQQRLSFSAKICSNLLSLDENNSDKLVTICIPIATSPANWFNVIVIDRITQTITLSTAN